MRRHHDMGGQDAGPVDQSEHDHTAWEKRVDAIMRLIGDDKRKLVNVNELRRGTEGMDEERLSALVTRDSMIGVTQLKTD
ncbi:MAG TPA: nitrile hydratase subunit beta [Rhodospirillales bacterium]|nr:nitrile hydratase subunit beta [Rhodospirillales bacterium]